VTCAASRVRIMGCKAKGPCVIDPNLPKGDVEKNPYCRYAMEHERVEGVGCPYWKGEKMKMKIEVLVRSALQIGK